MGWQGRAWEAASIARMDRFRLDSSNDDESEKMPELTSFSRTSLPARGLPFFPADNRARGLPFFFFTERFCPYSFTSVEERGARARRVIELVLEISLVPP